MAWIEFHSDELLDSQKFQDFRVKMSWTENEALGFLGRFWGKVLKLREAGDISGWRPDYVARLTGAKAHPEALWAEMSGVWVEERAGKVLVHDWLTYAGTYLKGRYKTRQREKLVEIWALHGKVYGAKEDPEEAGSPRESRGSNKGSPPYRPDRTGPDLTEPTGPAPGAGKPPDAPPPPERNGDSSRDDGRPDGGQGPMFLEASLFSKPWHFKGEHHMKRTGDLPPDYCRWALRNLTKMSGEEKLALEIIVNRDEKKKRGVA